MSVRTKLVSYRLTSVEFQKLSAQAKVCGLSPGAYAREALAHRLASEECERKGVTELHEQLKSLRADVALATRGILNVLTSPKMPTPEMAEEWVRKHLNR